MVSQNVSLISLTLVVCACVCWFVECMCASGRDTLRRSPSLENAEENTNSGTVLTSIGGRTRCMMKKRIKWVSKSRVGTECADHENGVKIAKKWGERYPKTTCTLNLTSNQHKKTSELKPQICVKQQKCLH